MEAEVLWRMQQVLSDLDDPVSAWDDLGWRNVPVQQHARESAVENLEIAIPKPEVLTTGQSSANLCPALIVSSGFHGQEMVNLHPQTPVAETGDLIDFSAEEEPSGEPPAEELGLGPNFIALCSALMASSEFHGQEMATRRFLQEMNSWTSFHSVPPLSWDVAVKFLMARKFDVVRAIELFHSYRSVRAPTGASIAIFTAKLHHPARKNSKEAQHTVLQALFYLLDRAVE
ncbi:hypothetical protein AB205_0114400, partial [Aquarana catesbeiana]